MYLSLFDVCHSACVFLYSFSFFFNDTATTEIYTLSLHVALPISRRPARPTDRGARMTSAAPDTVPTELVVLLDERSEEHTSELQSHSDLVCRLLLEKKKKTEHILLAYKHQNPQ